MYNIHCLISPPLPRQKWWFPINFFLSAASKIDVLKNFTSFIHLVWTNGNIIFLVVEWIIFSIYLLWFLLVYLARLVWFGLVQFNWWIMIIRSFDRIVRRRLAPCRNKFIIISPLTMSSGSNIIFNFTVGANIKCFGIRNRIRMVYWKK